MLCVRQSIAGSARNKSKPIVCAGALGLAENECRKSFTSSMYEYWGHTRYCCTVYARAVLYLYSTLTITVYGSTQHTQPRDGYNDMHQIPCEAAIRSPESNKSTGST